MVIPQATWTLHSEFGTPLAAYVYCHTGVWGGGLGYTLRAQVINTGQKAIIHQLNTMLANSQNALLPGHNHLLATGTEDLTLYISPKHQ